MSVGFRAVQWNRAKLIYDGIVARCRRDLCRGYAVIDLHRHPPKNLPEAIDIWLRATGSCAFLDADDHSLHRPAGAAQSAFPAAAL